MTARYYVSHTAGYMNEWIYEHEYAVVDSSSLVTVAVFYGSYHRLRSTEESQAAAKDAARNAARAHARRLNQRERTVAT